MEVAKGLMMATIPIALVVLFFVCNSRGLV